MENTITCHRKSWLVFHSDLSKRLLTGYDGSDATASIIIVLTYDITLMRSVVENLANQIWTVLRKDPSLIRRHDYESKQVYS